MRLSVAISLLVCFAVSPVQAADFPPVHRERIEWCRVWLTDANKTEKPRVLLIGDSIVAGHFADVEKRLKDDAYCGHLATSATSCDPAFFGQIGSVLDHYKFDVIVFNNGLHGPDYSPEEYVGGMKKFVAYLKKSQPMAKLIWRNSTPIMKEEILGGKDMPVERNLAVRAIITEAGIRTIDLYTPMSKHPDWFTDGVHYNDKARDRQGEIIAGEIKAALGK
jgi:hypothetical protein